MKYKLVPEEPTEKMLSHAGIYPSQYKELLDAAPSPLAKDGMSERETTLVQVARKVIKWRLSEGDLDANWDYWDELMEALAAYEGKENDRYS